MHAPPRGRVGVTPTLAKATGVIVERGGSAWAVLPYGLADWLYPGADVEVSAEKGVVVIKPRKRRNRPKSKAMSR